MRINFTRHIRITQLAALALIALLLTQLLELRRAAASSDESLLVEQLSMNYGKVTFCHGQTLRLSFTYAVDPARAEQPMPAIRAAAHLKDTSGNTIYIATQNGGVWKTTNGGQSCSFDVNRDQVALTGDPRTGAVAVVPELRIEVPAGTRPDFPTSLEITNDATGKVVFHTGRSVTSQQSSADRYSAIVFVGGWGSSLFSITRSETLLVNVTNPLPLTLANQPVAAIDYLINLKGVAGESSDVRMGRVKPGQTIVARFNRDRLPDAGEPATGSVRFIVEITYTLRLATDQLASLGGEFPLFPVTLELEEFANGATQTTHLDSYYGRGVYKSVDAGQSW